MNKKFKIILLTLLAHIPLILWQKILIVNYYYQYNGIQWQWWVGSTSLYIFLFMSIITFIAAYYSNRINKYRWSSYWLIAFTFIFAIVFDNSWIAQVVLFLSFIGFMIYPIRQKVLFKVYLDDSEDKEGKSRYVEGNLESFVQEFKSESEALNFIEKQIDNVLRKMAKDTCSLEELKDMQVAQNISYFIKVSNNDEKIWFRSYDYIQKNIERIFQEVEEKRKLNSKAIPNWLKLKKELFNDVDISKNSVDELIKLSKVEFLQLFTYMDEKLIVYLSNLNTKQLEKFYLYLEHISSQTKIEFQILIERESEKKINEKELKIISLEMPLFINFAKASKEKLISFEVNKEEVLSYCTKQEKNIRNKDDYDVLFLNAEYYGDDDLDYLLNIVEKLYTYYPLNKEYFFKSLSKAFAIVDKKSFHDIQSTNRFLEFFEKLPKIYEELSYSEIMELKNFININIQKHKVQENEVFDKVGSKDIDILMRYLGDLETDSFL